MKWTLIFAAQGREVQTFLADGDPSEAARAIRQEHEWLSGHSLIAAIEGAPRVLVRDDNHSDAECSLT
jgi:hypothetical protein